MGLRVFFTSQMEGAIRGSLNEIGGSICKKGNLHFAALLEVC